MAAQELRFPTGSTLFREGDPSGSAFYILSGQVELIKSTPSGTRPLALISAGEIIGEMGAFDGGPRSATARAKSDVVVMETTSEDFIEQLSEVPGFAETVTSALISRLRSTSASLKHMDFSVESLGDPTTNEVVGFKPLFPQQSEPKAVTGRADALSLGAPGVEKTFGTGDIIFNEDDPGDAAYVILSGRVSLLRKTEKGIKSLGVLGPGQIFGEMSIFDGSPRSATARAATAVTAMRLERERFRQELAQHAPVVIKQLTQRIRRVNELLVQDLINDETSVLQKQNTRTQSALETKKSPDPSHSNLVTPRLKFLLLDPEGRKGAAFARELVDACARQTHAKITRYTKPIAGDMNLQRAATLAADQRVDLVIWGKMESRSHSVHFRFARPFGPDEDRPGIIPEIANIVIPDTISDDLTTLFLGLCLGHSHPTATEKRQHVSDHLADILLSTQLMDKPTPLGISSEDWTLTRLVYGRACQLAASATREVKWFDRAAAAIRSVLSTQSGSWDKSLWIQAQKDLGFLRLQEARLLNHKPALNAAVNAFREALDTAELGKNRRLKALVLSGYGQSQYLQAKDLDSLASLQDAIKSYGESLGLLDNQYVPETWAENRHNQALCQRLLGVRRHSAEHFNEAATGFMDCLRFYDREKHPRRWAATKNNLGTTFYLQYRETDDASKLTASADCFAEALAVHMAMNSDHEAALTRRNLDQVERVLESL